jgi:ATP-dependent RNA helicase DHX8/PRP22
MEENELHDSSHEALRQALVSGLFQNTARLHADGRFRVLSTGQEAFLHPSSTLIGKKPKCIVFNELVLTSRPYAHMVSVIDSAWLPKLVPRYFAVAVQNAA